MEEIHGLQTTEMLAKSLRRDEDLTQTHKQSSQMQQTVHRDKDGKIVDLTKHLETKTDKDKLREQNEAALGLWKAGAKQKQEQTEFRQRLQDIKEGRD